MARAERSGALRIAEHKQTEWCNPTVRAMRVVLTEGEGRGHQSFVFIVPPGETRELDSRYDRAIHMIDCGRDDCYRKGRFCSAGHEGLIVGGLAPLLVRVGKNDTLDKSLDTALAEKEIAEAELTKLALVGQAKANVALAAAQRLEQLERVRDGSESAGASRAASPKKSAG